MTPAGSSDSHSLDGKARVFLCLLIALVYGEAAGYGYINDDFGLIGISLPNVTERSLHALLFRPVWYFSYWLTNLPGHFPWVDHTVNLALLMLAAGLAHRVALDYTGSRKKALVVCTAWVLLPWMTFPAVWISQRNDLLMYVFTFGALLATESERPALGVPLLALGLLSKETAMLVPAFFVRRSLATGRRTLAVAFVLLWACHLGVIVHHYAHYHTQYEAPHLAGLPPLVRLGNVAAHWVEPLFTQVVPLPFLTGGGHLLLHVAGLALLACAMRFRRAGFDRNAALLALLASFPSIITPQLRIVGFESFCWLLTACSVLAVRSRPLLAAALAVLTASSLISIGATMKNFQTPYYDAGAGGRSSETYYPNDYYVKKREFLLRLLGK